MNLEVLLMHQSWAPWYEGSIQFYILAVSHWEQDILWDQYGEYVCTVSKSFQLNGPAKAEVQGEDSPCRTGASYPG
jgi:hypothetical protein